MQPAVTAKRPKEMTDRPRVEGFTNPLSEVLGSIRIEKAEGAHEREAFCSFNKPEYANPLVKVFSNSFETCQKVAFA